MAEPITPLVVNIPNSVFYFKDAPHYLYGIKEASLLEDLKRYEYIFTTPIKTIHSSTFLDMPNMTVAIGYGSSYGVEYGGVTYNNKTKITLKLLEDDNGDQSVIGPLARLTFAMDISVLNPTRSLLSIDLVNQEINVAYTSNDGTANSFGINNEPGEATKEHIVTINNQSPYDTSGVLVANVPTQFYTINTTRDTTELSLATIVANHTANTYISLPISDTSILLYARAGDSVFITIPNKIIKLETTNDLPTPAQADRLTSYYIINTDTYYILDSSGSIVPKTSIPATVPRTMRFTVVDDGIGNVFSGNTLFIEPDNWVDVNFFNSTNTTNMLIQAMLDFWDGIPPGVKIITNSTDVVIDSIVDNKLHIKQITADVYTKVVIDNYATVQDIYYSNIDTVNSNPTATLIGTGIDYLPSVEVFLDDFNVAYELSIPRGAIKAPIVITDMLSSDIDLEEFTNVQFKLDDNSHLIFNRADNKIVNPTFLKESDVSSVIPGWNNSTSVYIHHDATKSTALLHDKSCALPDVGSYLYQFITKINPADKYSLSFYANSTDATLSISIYEFNNNGTRFTTEPLLGSATNIITYTPRLLTSTFTKYVARLYAESDFSKSDVEEFVTIGLPSLQSTTTDIIVYFSKTQGTTPVYLDCIQFENAANPTEFSHLYDYATVEYEIGNKDYSTRFVAGALYNTLNNGFMTLDIVSRDMDVSGLASEVATIKHRRKILEKVLFKPWAKLYGVSKFIQSSLFSAKRVQHKGEYFLLPKIPSVTNIAFQSSTLLNNQSIVTRLEEDNKYFIIAEGQDLSNLPDKTIKLAQGISLTSLGTAKNIVTNDLGYAEFTADKVYEEDIFPKFEFSTTGDIKFYVKGGAPNFNTGDYACYFNENGTYSQLFISSGGDETSLTPTIVATDFGYLSSDPNDYTHILPLDTKGLIKLPEAPLYSITPSNNGSAMLSFTSLLDNFSNVIPIYNNLSLPIYTSSFTKTVGTETFDFSVDSSFNPILSKIKVIDPSRDNLKIYQSPTKNNTGLYFYIDYLLKTIFVSDQGINSIQVQYTYHPITIDSNYLLFNRYLLFKSVQSLYNKIQLSYLVSQHTQVFNNPLQSTVQPNSTLNYPLYITANTNIDIVLQAKYNTLTKNATMTYAHKLPLI